MERIIYRKTLDVHKNGVQFMLQGFETADNLSRVIEISLVASGDAIDFPLERVVAMMYVTTPNATEPSINECTIKDNKVVYEVLPIVEEGITIMQLKIIETSPEGAKSVLGSPKFAVEVSKSNLDDGSAEQNTTFTALEDAVAKAKTVYDERFLRMELDSECIFKAYYADGTYYETDVLQKLFKNGNVLLSESYAHGGTGVRAGEDTDNSKYYSNVARSEALNAQDIMTNSREVLDEVRLHGVYTAFSVDFETGEVEYVSPSSKFKINLNTGELDAIGQTYSFNGEVERIVKEWLEANNLNLNTLQDISLTHSGEIKELQETTQEHSDKIEELELNFDEKMGPWNLDENVGLINSSPATIGEFFTSYSGGIGSKPTGQQIRKSHVVKAINSGLIRIKYTYALNGYYTGSPSVENHKQYLVPENSYIKFYHNGKVIHTIDGLDVTNIAGHTYVSYNVCFDLEVKTGDEMYIEMSLDGSAGGDNYSYASAKLTRWDLYANTTTPFKYASLNETVDTVTPTDILNTLLGVE